MSVFFQRRGAVPDFTKKASDYAIGKSVFLPMNGTPTEFLVVHQGLPSSDYDASCDGTWLLMKNIHSLQAYHTDDEYVGYDTSLIHPYLNESFYNSFDTVIRSCIKQVKIPYSTGSRYEWEEFTGENGLSTKIFLLSVAEVNYLDDPANDSAQFTAYDGAPLDYFKGSTDDMRVAYYNGNPERWWLRCMAMEEGNIVVVKILPSEYVVESADARTSHGIRPCIILPYDTPFDSKTNIFKEV